MRTIILFIFLVSANFAQSPLLTLFSSDEAVNLIPNSTFDNNDYWGTVIHFTIHDGVASFDGVAGGQLLLTDLANTTYYPIAWEVGATYRITYTISNTTDAKIGFFDNIASVAYVGYENKTNGTYIEEFVYSSGEGGLNIFASIYTGSSFDIDNVFLIKIANP